MDLVAEGVEHPAQMAFLREQGCPAAQGYLFSRPLALAEVAEFLGTWPERARQLAWGP